jgi:hypothetical protein
MKNNVKPEDSSANQLSSEVVSSQGDSLGPNTERFLLGSLLTPEGESSTEMAHDNDMYALTTFQDQPLVRKTTILEPVAEIQSQSHRS